MSLLNIQNLSVYYGYALAINGIDIQVQREECVSVIGPNGAGKTTLLRSISGIIDWKGEMIFNGHNLKNMSSSQIVRLGVVQAPEGRHLFGELDVHKNLEMGTFLIKDKKQISANFDYVNNLFPRLIDRANQLAGTLSGGEQQMLAIGRALMSSPVLLLLDEPSFGLAPLIKETISGAIKEIQKMGVTILLVEQDALMAFELARQIFVIEGGTISISGKSAALAEDPRIKKSYLGVD